MEEQKRKANHYDGIAGKVREELALDELCCNEQLCIFAGTEYCVKQSCWTCELHGCRGCRHLKECASEGVLN